MMYFPYFPNGPRRTQDPTQLLGWVGFMLAALFIAGVTFSAP